MGPRANVRRLGLGIWFDVGGGVLEAYESRVYATLLNNDIDLKIGHTFVTYHMTEEEAEKAKLPTLEQKRGL